MFLSKTCSWGNPRDEDKEGKGGGGGGGGGIFFILSLGLSSQPTDRQRAQDRRIDVVETSERRISVYQCCAKIDTTSTL